MAKPLSKTEWTGTKTDEAVQEHLKARSRNGHVWFARGIFGEVDIFEFANVSGIPDEWVGVWPRPELWKAGEPATFSAAQLQREENRGMCSD